MLLFAALFTVAQAQQPWEADAAFTAPALPYAPLETPHASKTLQSTSYRVSGEQLKRRGRTTTYTGLATMGAAIPLGYLVYASLATGGCEFECMGPPIFGAAAGTLTLTTGTVVTTAGLITSAVGRGRSKRERRSSELESQDLRSGGAR